VQDNSGCTAEEHYIPYLKAFYCTGGAQKWLLFVVYLVWMLLLFYALSEVAESFLVPAVEVCPCLTSTAYKHDYHYLVYHSAVVSAGCSNLCSLAHNAFSNIKNCFVLCSGYQQQCSCHPL